MKTPLSICAVVLCSVTVAWAADSGPVVGSSSYTVKERGPNHRVWEQIEYELAPDGRQVPRARTYTEIASGLCYESSPGSGKWNDTVEAFEILANGYAVATNGPQKLIISPALNDSAGAVDMMDSQGKRWRSTILGLSLYSRASDRSLALAEVAAGAVGELVASNEVVFKNPFGTNFAGVTVRYVYRKGEFHQDVLLGSGSGLDMKQIEAAGFPAADSVLEIWTEWFEAPRAVVTSRVVRQELNPVKRAQMAEPDLVDDELDFGVLKMPSGTAYLQNSGGQVGKPIKTLKRWVLVDQKQYLIESIPLDSLAPLFAQIRSASGTGNLLAGKTRYPGRRPPAPVLARKSHESILLAHNEASPRLASGIQLVCDYLTINGSLTNHVFRADEQWYVTGPVYLYAADGGCTVVEGNACVKYAAGVGAKLVFNGAVDFQTDAYRPAVFTAKDDRTVGQSYDFGNGNPTGYYATTALEFNSDADLTLRHVRVAYAQTAFAFNAITDGTDTFRHIQVRDCGTAFYVTAENFNRFLMVGNGLIAHVAYPLDADYFRGGTMEQVTLDRCTRLANDNQTADGTLAFTNCIFANVTNLLGGGLALEGDHNAFYNTTTFGGTTMTLSASPFQAAYQGQYYLAATSAVRNVGTTNISADLLTDLAMLTTYPPLVYTNQTISVDTEFSPQAQRDYDQPDYGAHYVPLDHLFGGCHAYANLTFTAGTAVGWFSTSSGWQHQGHGIHLGDNQTLVFDGTASAPVYWVRYNVVQESKDGAFGGYGPGGISGWASTVANAPVIVGRFLRCSMFGREALNHIRDDYGYIVIHARDSEFYGGCLGGYTAQHHFTNCLFDRTYIGVPGGGPDPQADRIFRDCTMHGGTFELYRWYPGYVMVSVRDSSLDSVTFSTANDFIRTIPTYNDYQYNAYTNSTNPLPIGGANDRQNVVFNWQTGPFGRYYLPWDSPLIDAGSVTAAARGLYHFTTQADGSKEGDSQVPTVDIGYHFVATDNLGNLLDDDGDGIPDYLEDYNGNGSVDSGETDWQNADDMGLKVRITRPKDNSIIP